MDAHRFPKSVFGQGVEPDPRFSLANERTFLAWIRTSLALILTGSAFEVLDFPSPSTLRLSIALLFIILGTIAAGWAWFGWMAAERALRLGKPLPGVNVAPIVSILIVLAAGMAVIGVLYDS